MPSGNWREGHSGIRSQFHSKHKSGKPWRVSPSVCRSGTGIVCSCYSGGRFPTLAFWGDLMTVSRRDFLATAVVGSLSVGLPGVASGAQDSANPKPSSASGKRPIIVCANNGFNYLDAAYAFLAGGGDTLDAALRVVKGPEDDPNDTSVGLGGIPNEEGVVELDACCMHGPTRRAGSVGGVRNIKNVSLGFKSCDGAYRARDAGGRGRGTVRRGCRFSSGEFADRSFAQDLAAVEGVSLVNEDWWGPGLDDPHWQPPDIKPQSEMMRERFRRLEERAADLGIAPELREEAVYKVMFPPTGTIHCSALNEKGEISGCTTTSGLAYKLPGRVGDSPIIGAGCYTDQDVGSAGATGSGEENIKVDGSAHDR